MPVDNIATIDAYLQEQWRAYVGVEPRDYRIVKRTMQEIIENKARSLAFWSIHSKFPYVEQCGKLDNLKKRIAVYEYSQLSAKLTNRFLPVQMGEIKKREKKLVDSHNPNSA